MATYILGMDGLDKEIVESNIDEFPNFAKLDRYELESIYPPITIPAWACSFSGLNPDKLEVFDFQMIDFEDYSFHPVKDEKLNSEGFWNYFDGKVNIAGIPGAGTPEINGISVGNLFYFSDVESKPESFVEKLDDGATEEKGLWSVDTEKEKRKTAHLNFEKRARIFDKLFQEEADVYYTVFRVSDTVMHHTLSEKHLVKAYRELDEYIGSFLENYFDPEEDNLIIISDHGAVKAEKRLFMNRLLEEGGFLERKEGGQNSRFDNLMLRLGDIAQRIGFRDLVSSMNTALDHYFEKNVAPRKSKAIEKIDFSETEAFSYMTGVSAYGGIWVNDQRFSNTKVEDRESKKSEIKEFLEEREEIRNVYYKEELYEENVEKFPDLVVECYEDTKLSFGFHPDITANVENYMHRKKGVLMARGVDIKSLKLENAELIDVAPTLMHLEGSDIPEHMDGKVLDIAKGEPNFVSKKDDETSGIDF